MEPPAAPVLVPEPALTADELAAALACLKDGVVILGGDFTILWVNQALAEMFDLTVDDIVGRPIVEFLHPDELEFAYHAVNTAGTEPERQVPGQYRLRHRDGSWLAVELSGAAVPAPHLGGTATIITARPTAHRDVLTNGYLDLTRGARLPSVLDAALEWYRERTQRYRMALSFVDVLGDGWSYVGDDLPHELRGLPPESLDGASPWGRVLAGEDHVVVDIHDLPHAIGKCAREAGLRSVMVLGVADPSGTPALLSFWIDADPTFFPQGYTVKTPALILIELALERRQHIAQLEQAATTDPLTKLANRRVFFDLLEHQPSPRTADTLAVLYLDLDGFKDINDQLGHEAGDRLLVEVAERLRANLRPSDVLARLGGDEFGVFCPGMDSDVEAATLADRLLEAVACPVSLSRDDDDDWVTPSVSIGIAIGDTSDGERVELVAAADEAMYAAKRAGKGRWLMAPRVQH